MKFPRLNHYKSSYLIATFVVWLTPFIATAETVEGKSVDARLREILSRPEYQPRRASSGIFDAYKRAIGEYLDTLMKRISHWLQGIEGPSIGDSVIGRWLVDAIVFLREAMFTIVVLTVIAAVIYCAYKVLAPLIRDRKAKLIIPKHDDATLGVLPPSTPLSELIALGRYQEALVQMHCLLRQLFQQRYNVPLSATDNEAKYVLLQNGFRIELFRDVASFFERSIYAGGMLEPNSIELLYARFKQDGDLQA